MKHIHSAILLPAIALLAILLWVGCEPVYEVLKLHNNSDQTVHDLINLAYPDTTLHRSIPDRPLKPHSSGYLMDDQTDLREAVTEGITIFLFDNRYFKSSWNEIGDPGAYPDTYLEEDSLLKKWILTRAELDSIDWELYYP